jgi:lipid A ethanolaminephosphotransferase
VLWLGAAVSGQLKLERACLAGQRDAALTHDNLFHSTLGLLGIRAAEYKPGLDAFAACRAP